MSRQGKKARWSTAEDQRLRDAVQAYPFQRGPAAVDWKDIAATCGKSTKQCRERWTNVLDPSIRRTPWTREEILALFEAQREIGNKWSTIAARLPGRPETAVKNVFHAAIRREKRRDHARRNGLPVPAPFHECMAEIPYLAEVVATTHAAATQVASDRNRASRKRLKSSHRDEDGAGELGVVGALGQTYTVFTSPDGSSPMKKAATTRGALGVGSPQPRFLVVNCPVKVDIPADPLAVWLGIVDDPSVPVTTSPAATPAEAAEIDDFLDSVLFPPAVPFHTMMVKSEPKPTAAAPAAAAAAAAAPAPVSAPRALSVLSAPSVATTATLGTESPAPSLKRDRADTGGSSDSVGTLSDAESDGALGALGPAEMVKFSFGDVPFKVVAGPGLPVSAPGTPLQTYETEHLKVEHPSSLGMDGGLDKALSGIMMDLPPEDDFSWFTTGDALPALGDACATVM